MENQVDTSGEWVIGEQLAMAERLKEFWPNDPNTGQRVTQGEWATQIGMNGKSFGDVLAGRVIKTPNHLKIVRWMLRAGYKAENILWWQVGPNEGKPPGEKKIVRNKRDGGRIGRNVHELRPFSQRG